MPVVCKTHVQNTLTTRKLRQLLTLIVLLAQSATLVDEVNTSRQFANVVTIVREEMLDRLLASRDHLMHWLAR